MIAFIARVAFDARESELLFFNNQKKTESPHDGREDCIGTMMLLAGQHVGVVTRNFRHFSHGLAKKREIEELWAT